MLSEATGPLRWAGCAPQAPAPPVWPPLGTAFLHTNSSRSQRCRAGPWPLSSISGRPSSRSAPRVNRQLQPGWARFELFSVLRTCQGRQQRRQSGLRAGAPASWTKGAQGGWGLRPGGGSHSGPSWHQIGEGKDSDAGATGAGAFERQQQPGCSARLARGTLQCATRLGEGARALREVCDGRPASPGSKAVLDPGPGRHFASPELGWGKPGLLGVASN